MTKKTQLPAEIVKVQNEVAAKITDNSLVVKLGSNYAPLLQEATDFAEQVASLEKGNAQHLEKARRIRIDLGKLRSRKNEQKAADKNYYLAVGKYIDSLSNTVENAITIAQHEAKEIENYFENQEKARIEKLRSERWEQLSQYLEEEPLGLGDLTEQVFNTLLSGAKKTYEDKIEAERQAEIARQEAERKAQLRQARKDNLYKVAAFVPDFHSIAFEDLSEAEYTNLVAKANKDADAHAKEQEKIRKENEKLKKEKAAEEARLKAEEEEKAQAKAKRVAKIVKALEGIGYETQHNQLKHIIHRNVISNGVVTSIETDEAARQFVQQHREWVTIQDKLKKVRDEEEARKAREAKEKAEREAEEEAKRQAEEEARKAPDREKIKAAVEGLTLPELDLTSEESKAAYNEIQAKLEAYKTWALKQTK